MLIFQDVPGSNLGPEARYANKVSGFPESLQEKSWDSARNRVTATSFYAIPFIIRRMRALTSKICRVF